MTIDDPEALARTVADARAGDPHAGHALVEMLHPLVIRIVRSHRPRHSAEEDLAQDIFIKLFSRLDQYRERDGIPFTHWVSRLAVRTCLDCLRSERRRSEVRHADLTDDQARWIEFLAGQAAMEATDALPDPAAVETVALLLSALSPEDRLVIQWLDLEQRSVREIAALTGWSQPAVKVRAFRARHRLRKLAMKLGIPPHS